MLGVRSLHILLAGKLNHVEKNNNSTLIRCQGHGRIMVGNWWCFRNILLCRSPSSCCNYQFTPQNWYEKFISKLLKNPVVLCNYNNIRSILTKKVTKGLALNLLKHRIMLYFRVRVFSFVKDECDLQKIASKKKKARSLRTNKEIFKQPYRH